MSSHTEASFMNSGGTEIYTQQWLPEKMTAKLIIVHGLGEHSGRYAHVADYFNTKGIGVFALDHVGHGRSGGKRGHIDSADRLVRDLEQYRAMVCDEYPDSPTILYGHSMGGLISFLYLLDYQQHVDAAILSAPPVDVKIKPPAWQLKLLRLLQKLAPSMTQNNGLDAAWLSHDPAIVKAYQNDPLVHAKISIALYSWMTAGGQRCLSEANRITTPALFVIGGEDKIIDGEAVHRAFEKIKNPSKKEIVFDGDYHEIHNEADKQVLFDKIWEWLRDVLALS